MGSVVIVSPLHIGHDMPGTKNSNRKKRKYGDARKIKTAQNRTARLKRHDLRQAKMIERTQALIGQHVAVRIKDQAKPSVGTVVEILRLGDEGYPERDARRKHGAFVRVRTTFGEVVRSRHRVKPIK